MPIPYLDIADAIAQDISSGRLRAGQRLWPQRDFAYRRGVAVSTVSRAYSELVRRGLVTGEVGRGTFVRGPAAPAALRLAEPAGAPVDLQLNFSIPLEGLGDLGSSLEPLLRGQDLASALCPATVLATGEARRTTAEFIARAGWSPDPDAILFAGNGRQALSGVLAAVAPPGSRLGVEAMTYPLIKAIAARLNLILVPLEMDAEGLRPDAVLAAQREQPLRALYLQPTLHNPLGMTMSPARRSELAKVLRQTGILAVEDAVYAFLADEAPLAAVAPDCTVLVDSLSKRIAPGLTLGFLAAPEPWREAIANALRSGSWLAGGFSLAAGLRWMSDGTAARIVEAKRAEAAFRNRIAHQRLRGLTLRCDPRAFHLWLELPPHWRAEAFAAAAARDGIALAPANAFAVMPGHAPNAVRLALALPSLDDLKRALGSLRALALTTDYDLATE